MKVLHTAQIKLSTKWVFTCNINEWYNNMHFPKVLGPSILRPTKLTETWKTFEGGKNQDRIIKCCFKLAYFEHAWIIWMHLERYICFDWTIIIACGGICPKNESIEVNTHKCGPTHDHKEDLHQAYQWFLMLKQLTFQCTCMGFAWDLRFYWSYVVIFHTLCILSGDTLVHVGHFYRICISWLLCYPLVESLSSIEITMVLSLEKAWNYDIPEGSLYTMTCNQVVLLSSKE